MRQRSLRSPMTRLRRPARHEAAADSLLRAADIGWSVLAAALPTALAARRAFALLPQFARVAAHLQADMQLDITGHASDGGEALAVRAVERRKRRPGLRQFVARR